MRGGPGTTVDFAEVAPFAWDRVYFFGPYTPRERIHTSLGFHWPGVESTTIEWDDGKVGVIGLSWQVSSLKKYQSADNR